MAKLDKEELKKLPLAERIKKLKELEEDNKKEIEEAEKLIKETEDEIGRESITEGVAVPETKQIDIESLFGREKGLEATVREEAQSSEGGAAQNTLYQLAQGYEEAKDMLYSGESLTSKQLEWIDQLGERVEKARYETTTADVANLVVATRSVLHKLRKYHQQEGTFL